MVPQVVVDPHTQVVRFRAVAWEHFNVPVHVSQGVILIGRWQLGKIYCMVAVAHRVVRVQFYCTPGVLDTVLGLKCRRYGVGVRAAVAVGRVGGFRLYPLADICGGGVVAGAVEVLPSPVVVQASYSCLLLGLLFSNGGWDARRLMSDFKDSPSHVASENNAYCANVALL